MNIVFSGAEFLTDAKRVLIRDGVLAALGDKSRGDGELCLILVNDEEIQRINKKFLGHDYKTDVIAFPYENDGSPPSGHFPSPRGRESGFGDIYIGLDVARRQAGELGHDLFQELLTLAVHGALHLVGYDDHNPADKKKMFVRQEAVVKRMLQ